jgi:hypothetical protein
VSRSDSPGGHRLHARPVFLDRSGQRRRRFIAIGAALAAALVAGLAVLALGFMGSSSGHVPGFPDAERPPSPAAPAPSASSRTSTTAPSTAPKPTPSASPAAASPSPTSKRHYPSHPPRPSKSR